MKRNRQPSTQTAAVLLALGEDSTAWRYGYELCQETGLKAGSMYPILMRLADRGLLETNWESDVPVGRPPRHLYRKNGLFDIRRSVIVGHFVAGGRRLV
jgi:PadR family transcriptional regulator PadR